MAPVAINPDVMGRACARADIRRWSVSPAAFERALAASVAHASLGGHAVDQAAHVESLHLEDLALAVACADGHEGAWEHFVREFRPALYQSADAIDPTGGARELADALYADLFGLTAGPGERRSLFRHFHGRSRLATWLRAVLSQRHIDAIRARRRFDPMPEVEVAPESAAPAAIDPERPRFQQLINVVLVAAVSALAPRDRLRLSLYYSQDLTLAQIGRLLHEHEGSVSRHLTRIRHEVRHAMEVRLRDDHHLDEPAIDECFRAVLQDAGPIDLRLVLQEEGGLAIGKKPARDRSS